MNRNFIELLHFGRIVLFAEILIAATMLYAQPIPQEFGVSARSGYLLDNGLHWDANRTFHPYDALRWQSPQDTTHTTTAGAWLEKSVMCFTSLAREQDTASSNGLSVLALAGLGVSGQSGAAQSYDHLGVQPQIRVDTRYHHNWYARLAVRTTNEPASLENFTGTTKEVERAGLKSAEVDEALLGYSNRWATLEYGRTREIWGPGATTNFLLSGSSPSYERIMLELRFGRISYRYFYAFLETKVDSTGKDFYNRYLVGRCLEYNNRKNLILGIGEISLLAGVDRPVDWGFFNPIGVHLEIEQNNRHNSINPRNQNDIVFANFDWMARKNLRVSGMVVVDEFQLDQKERKSSADALGMWGQIVWTPLQTKFANLSWIGSLYRCETYTLQHSSPYTNTMTRNKLLGDPRGNDSEDYQTGFRVVFAHPVLLEVLAGQQRWGGNRLQDHPYTAYQEFITVPFPSGEIRTNKYLALKLDCEPIQRLNIGLKGHLDIDHQGTDSGMEQWTVTMSYYVPVLYSAKDEK